MLCAPFISMLLAMAVPIPAQAQTASVPYWHLWTGEDGKSHLTQCTMTSFEKRGGGTQMQRKEPGPASLIIAVNPKGDWHENPTVQWIVPLQGAFYVQAQDGSEAVLQPGTVMLGEDLATKPDGAGHKGHVSANKGDKPLVLMIAQLDAKPTVEQPCHAK